MYMSIINRKNSVDDKLQLSNFIGEKCVNLFSRINKYNLTYAIVLFLFTVFNIGVDGQVNIPVYLDDTKSIEDRIDDAISLMSLEEKVAMCHAQSRFSSKGNPELGIPELMMSDGPHGIRMEIKWDIWDQADWTSDSCTAFPALTCLAATFNPALSYLYGKALGEEARYRGKDVLLGPGVNIYRTPFNGRNFEYMGEDPYLSSKIVVPYIKGVQLNGVAACLKHFALNNQEDHRLSVNVEVSDRALHEIYLPAFKAGVQEGKVWSVMGAYNKFRGDYCNQNDLLLNQILKKDWNFDGVVISDWGSVTNTKKAALSGLDIEMGSLTQHKNAYNHYFFAEPFIAMLKSGEISSKVLDDKVRRILRLHFRTTMNRNRPYGSFASTEHFKVSQQIAEEGIVLLKNTKNLFPIKKGQYKRILIVGENATKMLTTGGGSSELKVKKEITPLKALSNKYGDELISYTLGYTSNSTLSQNLAVQDSLLNKAVEMAGMADVVIYVGGLNKDKHQDSEAADRLSYDLPYNQNRLIEALLNTNKNVGLVMISGNAYAMPWIKKAPSILQSWYLGSVAGDALANVISGDVNPSGKLPFSFPVKLEDSGAHAFGKSSYPGIDGVVTYLDDILVGYRWFDAKKIKPQFSFGHGLSYTSFDINNIKTDREDYEENDTIKVSFIIKNAGKITGSEVVQLYISQKSPSMLRPQKELKGFEKIRLNANENQKVCIEIPAKSLAFYHDKESEWILEKDEYWIHIALSAENVIKSIPIRIQ